MIDPKRIAILVFILIFLVFFILLIVANTTDSKQLSFLKFINIKNAITGKDKKLIRCIEIINEKNTGPIIQVSSDIKYFDTDKFKKFVETLEFKVPECYTILHKTMKEDNIVYEKMVFNFFYTMMLKSIREKDADTFSSILILSYYMQNGSISDLTYSDGKISTNVVFSGLISGTFTTDELYTALSSKFTERQLISENEKNKCL